MSLSNCEISRDPPHAQWGSKLGPQKSVAHVISWAQQLALNSSSLYLQHIQQTKTISLMCGYISWNPWYNRVDEQARASYCCWCSPVYITLFWLYACEIMLSFWIFNYGGTPNSFSMILNWYSEKPSPVGTASVYTLILYIYRYIQSTLRIKNTICIL